MTKTYDTPDPITPKSISFAVVGEQIDRFGSWIPYRMDEITLRRAQEHLDSQSGRADRRNLSLDAVVTLYVPAEGLPDQPTFTLVVDRPDPEPEPYVPQAGDVIRHRRWASDQVMEVLYVGHTRLFGRLMGASPNGRRLTGGGAEGSYLLDQPGAWIKVR